MKIEEVPVAAGDNQQDIQAAEQQQEQSGAAQAAQVKEEADKGGHQSRKRPYEETRSYGYYERREEKRFALRKLFYIILHL